MRRKVSFLLPFLFLSNVSFAGIPTLDIGTIGAIGQQIMNAKKQFDEAKSYYQSQINQFQDLNNKFENEALEIAKRTVGNLQLASPQSASFLNKKWFDAQTLKEAQNLLQNNSQYLENKNMISNLLKTNNFFSDLQDSNKKRGQRVQQLFDKAKSVENPKDKQDVSNALQAEMLQLQVDQMQFEAQKKLIEQDEKIREELAYQKFKQKHYGTK